MSLVVSHEIYDSLMRIVKSLQKRRPPDTSGLWTCSQLIVLALIKCSPGDCPDEGQEHYDRDYGYVFQYPTVGNYSGCPKAMPTRTFGSCCRAGKLFMVVVDKTNNPKNPTSRTILSGHSGSAK
jgi:hypothetical protein